MSRLTHRMDAILTNLMDSIEEARMDNDVSYTDPDFQAAVKDWFGREIWDVYVDWIKDED